jgi:4-amino-4-deoxy-L-arabinose transferase-like glycosyltransferase
LYGSLSGLLAVALWCFCPNVLAHAQMITPDAGATALGIAACYLFWHWLRSPDWGGALNAGFVLGLAELCKTSWILLFALWPMLWVVWRLSPHVLSSRLSWRREGLQLVILLVLAIWVVNVGYIYEDSFQLLKDFSFISKTLTTDEGTGQRKNRFADTWLGDVPIPLPRNYLLGIDVQKSEFEQGHLSYLHGELRHGGWWYYYLYGLAIKTPLGTLLLLLLAILRIGWDRQAALGWRNEMILLAPGLLLLAFVSAQTGFNHHLRYVLPALPFLFIWISRAALPLERGQKVWRSVLLGALAWSIGSSLAIYPHSLSYFNESVGGPLHGSEYLTDSNIDWGQDLLYLKHWLDEHSEAEPLGLAYFGYIDPAAAGISFTLPPKGPVSDVDREHPRQKNLGPLPGWYAISVSLLRGYRYPVANGRGGMEYLDEPYFTYFQQCAPVARVGYSILIYHLEIEECNRVRAELGLLPLEREPCRTPVGH